MPSWLRWSIALSARTARSNGDCSNAANGDCSSDAGDGGVRTSFSGDDTALPSSRVRLQSEEYDSARTPDGGSTAFCRRGRSPGSRALMINRWLNGSVSAISHKLAKGGNRRHRTQSRSSFRCVARAILVTETNYQMVPQVRKGLSPIYNCWVPNDRPRRTFPQLSLWFRMGVATGLDNPCNSLSVSHGETMCVIQSG
jgi:hypothetical protein